MIELAILTASPVTLAETGCITQENILEAYHRYIHKILTPAFTDILIMDNKLIKTLDIVWMSVVKFREYVHPDHNCPKCKR